MVTIGMNYHVRAGKEEVFEKAFQRVRGAMNKMEGHDESRLYRSVGEDSSEYLILSRWSSEEGFWPATAWRLNREDKNRSCSATAGANRPRRNHLPPEGEDRSPFRCVFAGRGGAERRMA